MYDGHMVPSSFFRHSPMPLHISTAAAKPPCEAKSSIVSGCHALYAGPMRSDSVIAGASTIFPGFIKFFGSKAFLMRRNAS